MNDVDGQVPPGRQSQQDKARERGRQSICVCTAYSFHFYHIWTAIYTVTDHLNIFRQRSPPVNNMYPFPQCVMTKIPTYRVSMDIFRQRTSLPAIRSHDDKAEIGNHGNDGINPTSTQYIIELYVCIGQGKSQSLLIVNAI